MDERTRTILIPSPLERFKAKNAQLEVLSGPEKGKKKIFSGFILRVGSATDNDLVLQDDTVSKHHFQIELGPYGYRIRDLDSKNGLTLGDLRVLDGYLPRSCKLQAGAVMFRFKLIAGEEEKEITSSNRLGRMVGQSLPMRRLFALLLKISPTSATILLEGESGTGKEVVSETIHELSGRTDYPFEVFDCTAFPSQLMESHLFGHEKGAFTGADVARSGVLERANNGTLLIDEIGELSLELQTKLLRAIDRKSYRRLGSDKWQSVDVRFIAATNRNLEEEVEKGTFRKDLFYRLAVVRIGIPALRERQEDIPLLVEELESELGAEELGERIPIATIQAWQRHTWPGNVRELRNAVERSLLLGSMHIPSFNQEQPITENVKDFWRLGGDEVMPFKEAKARLLADFERGYWTSLLDEHKGNVTRAAQRGGIHRKSLEYLMKKLMLER
jgi:DNA-binding NtrC family response regulator